MKVYIFFGLFLCSILMVAREPFQRGELRCNGESSNLLQVQAVEQREAHRTLMQLGLIIILLQDIVQRRLDRPTE